MKIFISVDMEGIAGVTNREHVGMKGVEYEMARRWMTAETNAAIEGAFDSGATEIVVADSHAQMCNILPDELHPEAQLVRGTPRPLFQMEGLDSTFSGAFLIGYHARAGDARGILSHTHVSRIVYELQLNGKPVNEATFNSAVAGHMGVPVLLVAGDDTLAVETKAALPWAEQVITKWAVSPFAARNLAPKGSQARIRAAAKAALARIQEMELFTLEAPIQFEVAFLHPIFAYLVADIPGVDRLDGTRVRYIGADMLEINRIWRLMINASLSSFTV